MHKIYIHSSISILLAFLLLPNGSQGQAYDLTSSLDVDIDAEYIEWPWSRSHNNYFNWWSDQLAFRLIEHFHISPSVRYLHQASTLTYLADATIFGGQILLDDDILNGVNLPTLVERELKDVTIELPSGILSNMVQSWTSQARLDLTIAGISIRGAYWAGALAPQRFPQPQDIRVLFNKEKLIDIAAQELATTSALNNAVSLEVSIHPIQWLTGFRELGWSNDAGLYLGGDISTGIIRATDLTFKQGRELLGDIDMGQEIRDILPNTLEGFVDTDRAGELLLTAAESRLPLYGFGLPNIYGRTSEYKIWFGYQWSNRKWAGDAQIGLSHQRQHLTNDHPSAPTLKIQRWTPHINVKWIFNKQENQSTIFNS